MKTINYRNAVLISLHDSWEVQDEPGVQAAFFETRPNAGTLRVSVFGFAKDDDGVDEPMPTVVEGPYLAMSRGARMYTQERPAPGRPHLLMRNWIFQVPQDKNSYRLVFFSHTIEAKLKDTPEAVAEFALVDKAVRDAHISVEPTVSAYDRFSPTGSFLG
jgi:hypothetical protein